MVSKHSGGVVSEGPSVNVTSRRKPTVGVFPNNLLKSPRWESMPKPRWNWNCSKTGEQESAVATIVFLSIPFEFILAKHGPRLPVEDPPVHVVKLVVDVFVDRFWVIGAQVQETFQPSRAFLSVLSSDVQLTLLDRQRNSEQPTHLFYL